MKPHAIVTIANADYIFFTLQSICAEVKKKMQHDITMINIHYAVNDRRKNITHNMLKTLDIECVPDEYRQHSVFSGNHDMIRSKLGYLEKLLDHLKSKYTIVALLLADDEGWFEKFAISYFNACQVPVVLWAHGATSCMAQLFSPDRPWLSKYDREQSVSEASNGNITIPVVYPRGFNGHYTICTNSASDTTILGLLGVSAQMIRQTGNPALDRLIATWKDGTPPCKPRRGKVKILFISTGYLKFHYRVQAAQFYQFFLSCIQHLPRDAYELFLRLKPGEDIKQISGLHEALLTHNVTIVDNSRPLIETLSAYDIVSSDASSGLIEAIFCRIPCVRLMRFPPFFPGGVTMLPLLNIVNPHESDEVMRSALSPDYVMLQDQGINEREALLFHRLDGLATNRIADVVIEAIKNARADYQ